MSRYRLVWTVIACVLGGLGAVVALQSIAGGVLFSIGALAGVSTAVAHYSLSRDVAWARKKNLVEFSALGAALGVGCSGYVELMGLRWIPAALVLAALSPAVLARVLRLVGRFPGAPTSLGSEPARGASHGRRPASDPVPGDPVVETCSVVMASAASMTMAELCLAWRASFLALCRLHDGRDPVRRAELVTKRQHYLDELENRDPAGFARWLAAGAGPGSNPSRYLKSVDGPRPTP